MNVLVIHGPNLNVLGTREPATYGAQTLAGLHACIAAEATSLGVTVRCVQYNSEGAIVEALHAARGVHDAIVIKPGAYTHHAYAIRDAIAAIDIRAIELHLTNTRTRAKRFARRAS